MIIDVFHEPRCNVTFDQLRRESQIRDRSIRVKIIRIFGLFSRGCTMTCFCDSGSVPDDSDVLHI